MNNILILDGYNLIYRARHTAMRKGNNSTIFNFFRSIRPLIEKFNPDITYFVLEGKPKARIEADPNYKAQRTYHDKDDFRRQRKEIISLIKKYYPFIVARHSDYECDDIINYLANVKHAENSVTIISSDTDFIQSINENTKLYSPIRKTFIEATQYDYVKWKALVGDKSDNIEGFKGIGDKKAKLLLENNEKLLDLLSNEENKNKFELNQFMIRFHDLGKDQDNIEFTLPEESIEWNSLREIFQNYEFKSLTDKDSSWQKYINTFDNLERNIKHVS